MKKTCYCVCYNGHSSCAGETLFCIEKSFYTKDKAIDLAIKLNIELLEQIYEEDLPKNIKLLTNEEKSHEQRLEDYIDSLDYSRGNYRYEDSFYDVKQCEVE